MAVVNTITITKSGGTFTEVADMKTAFLTAMDDSAYEAHMATLRDANSLVTEEAFDASTQTYTLTRTWDDAAYATWNSAKASDVATHKSKLESLGYTTDSQIT
tara:strand:- start:312 stop:620 length:309 start_codon:yes stop_codon:yes gene_type:complete